MSTTTTTPAPPADKRKALGRGLDSLLPGGPRPAVAGPAENQGVSRSAYRGKSKKD